MVAFRQWLFQEERRLIDAAVMDSYERAFQQGLGDLIGRTRNPQLKTTFEGMKECPIKDSTGRCYSFSGWIVNSLLRHGCHQRIDPEAALNYVAFRLLSPIGETGKKRASVFDFDEGRPWQLGTNPLEARFKTYVVRDVRNICGGRVPRLLTVHRPQGTLTITQRQRGDDQISGTVAADEIPDRRSSDERELMADIMELLKRRSTPDIPLVSLFRSILDSEGTREQRRRFGRRATDVGREIIFKTLGDYARSTQNWELLRLLASPTRPDPSRQRPKPTPKPKLPPDVQDYLSIIQVIDAAGGRASMAILGRKRSRWLQRKPRDPRSPHQDRLHDVLARMIHDGVLAKRGAAYVPGPNYEAFKARTDLAV